MKLSAKRIWLCGWLGCLVMSSSALGQTKLMVGYGAVSADQLVLWVAKDMGIFTKNQIEAQLVFFVGGALSVTAMVSGDTPMIQASGPGVVSASLAGSSR